MAVGRGTLDLTARITADTADFERRTQAAARSSDEFRRELARMALEAQHNRRAQAQLAGDLGITVRELGRLEREAEGTRRAQARLSQETDRLRESAARGAVVFGGALVAGLGAAAREAVRWESAWAGVTKTVNGTPEQLAAISQGLRDLSREIPTSAADLAAIAENAGQLGVQTDAVLEFTRVAAALGETTNLSAEEAASGLAKIANVMGTSQQDFDRMASTLVAVGNAGASTERDILEMSLRLASAGATAELSESQVLGIANALSSVGLSAEAGGGAISRVMGAIDSAVTSSSDNVEVFARVSGQSVAEFRENWGRDAAGALTSFISGLGEAEAAGQDVYSLMKDAGFRDSEIQRALLAAGNAGGLLADSVRLANDAWRDNSALVEEANKRYETSESRLLIARNQLTDLAVDLGAKLLPALVGLVETGGALVGWLADLPGPVQTALLVVGGLGAAATLTGGAIATLAPKIAAARVGIAALAATTPGATVALGGLGTAAGAVGAGLAAIAGPATLVAGAAAGLGYAFSWVQGAAGWRQQAADIDSLTVSLAEYLDTGRASGEMLRAFGPEMERFRDAVNDVADPNAAQRLVGAFDWITPWSTSMEEARARTEEMDAALTQLAERGAADQAARLFDDLGLSVDEAAAVLPRYTEHLRDSEAASRQAADTAMASLSPALQDTARQMGLSAEEAEAYEQRLQDVAQTLDGFSSPLGVYQRALSDKQEAERASFEQTERGASAGAQALADFEASASLSLTEYAAALEADNAAQRDWQRNLVIVAGRAGEEVAAALAQMGTEGVRLTAEMANGTDAETRRAADALRENLRLGGQGAAQEYDQAMQVLAGLSASGGQRLVDQLNGKLRAGQITFAQIVSTYGGALADGLNPLLVAMGASPVQRREAVARQFPNAAVRRSEGGAVWGAGTATSDSIPALLSNGEYVIRASSVQRYGPGLMDAINEGRFALGGLVRQVRRYARGGFIVPDDVPRPPGMAPLRPPISTVGDLGMGRAHSAARDYVARNVIPTGGVGLAGQPMGVQQMMGIINSEFGPTRLISGLRPGAITATGKPSYHGKGRAVDLPPSMALFEFLRRRFPNARELIFSPAGGRQINNGRPHVYTGITKAMHYDHVHLAMRNGGLVRRAAGGPVGVRSEGGRLVAGVLPSTAEEAQALVDAYREQIDALDSLREREALLAEMRATGAEWARVEAAFHASRDETERARLMDEHSRLSEEGVRQRQRLGLMDQQARRAERLLALERQLADVRAREDAAEAARDLFSGRLDDLRGLLAEQEQITSRVRDARARMREQVAEQRRELAERVADLKRARREELQAWASLTEPVAVSWASSVGAITRNVDAQVRVFEEWTSRLAQARRRGVSEEVIRSLGLDEGPEALGQLRQFGRATQAEIDALNAAVARQQAAAGRQTEREARSGLTRLGAQLVEAQEEAHERIARLQADFATTQREAAADLARLGQDQALTYTDAIARGLASGIPGIQAQARLVAQALRGISVDQAVTASGGNDLAARIRAIFTNRGVPIGTAQESEAARVARIVREVQGGRSLDSVRQSVDWIRSTMPAGSARSQSTTVTVLLDGATIGRAATRWQSGANARLTVRAGSGS